LQQSAQQKKESVSAASAARKEFEWRARGQIGPSLTLCLFAFAMVILAFSTFYTKIMSHYYYSNPYESFYVINFFNLLFFGVLVRKTQAEWMNKED